MRKIVLATAALGIFSFGSLGVANALWLDNGTYVGDPDNFIASITGMVPNEANELEWINLVTGENYDSLLKTDDVDVDWWQVYTDEGATNLASGTYAFELQSYRPAYWLINTGNVTPGRGNTPTQVHYLFANVDSFDWAVFNLASEEFPYSLSGIGQVSHVSESGSYSVPEPATMLLFGAGLVGLAAVGRRRKS